MYNIMTPGPTQVRENVRLSRSLTCTNPDLDPEFYTFYKETCELISSLLRHAQRRQYLVQSMEDCGHLFRTGIFSHMSQADDLTRQNVEGSCEHDAVFPEHGIQDIFCGDSFRHVENGDGIGKSGFLMEPETGCGDGGAGGFRDSGMAVQKVRIIFHIFQSCAEPVDVAYGHGIREPLIFIPVVKSQKIGIEGSHRCFPAVHGGVGVGTYGDESKSGRRGERFL